VELQRPRKKFWDDLDCGKKNYFPVVDLLGGVVEVTYQPVFLPPASFSSLENVLDLDSGEM